MNNILQFNDYYWGYPHLGNNLNNRWENITLDNLQLFGYLNEESSKIWLSGISSIKEQIRKNPERLKNINPQDFVIAFVKILDTFLYLCPLSIYPQITSLNSLSIKSETNKGNIYAEVFFDEVTGWQTETVINIFRDQQLEFNNSGSLEDMLLAINRYFDNQEIDYSTYLNQTAEYALPGTAFATADF